MEERVEGPLCQSSGILVRRSLECGRCRTAKWHVKRVGILRLRSYFAKRSADSAQDDKALTDDSSLGRRNISCISSRSRRDRDRCGQLSPRRALLAALVCASPEPAMRAWSSSRRFLRWKDSSSSSTEVATFRGGRLPLPSVPSSARLELPVQRQAAAPESASGRDIATVSSWKRVIMASNMSKDSRLYSTSGSCWP